MWIHVVPHCWFLTGLAAGLTKGGRIASRAALLAGGSRWTAEVARGAGKAIASRNLEKWRCTQQKMMIYIDIIDLPSGQLRCYGKSPLLVYLVYS
jgi:hypothetical protein